MKKLLTIALSLFLFSMASCKKDITCTCIESGSNPGADAFLFPNTTKKKAKDACDLILTTSQGDYVSCEVK